MRGAVAVVIDQDPPLLATAARSWRSDKMVIRALCEAENLEVQSQGCSRGRGVGQNGLRDKDSRVRSG